MLQLGPGVPIPPPGSASPTAVRRLQKDYAKLMQDPVDGIVALPNEDNILEWHYCLKGSPDTPFAGGYYWGKVIFKENFPWSPPAITMITPNGRFATNVRLCLSISDYHPESWNPGWTVSAILLGVHSFMNENMPAAGSVSSSPQEQKNLALASKEFNCTYKDFRKFFPNFVKEWTGVLPVAGEPNVAPVMLPEHATPAGIPLPALQSHGRGGGYAAQMVQYDELMQGILRRHQQPAQLPGVIPPMPAAPPGHIAMALRPRRAPGAVLNQMVPMPPQQPVAAEVRRAERLARFGMDRGGVAQDPPANVAAQNNGGPPPKRARTGNDQDDAIVVE